MSNPLRNTMVAATVLLAALMAAPACQCDGDEPVKKAHFDITIEPDAKDAPHKFKPIKDIDISAGDTIRFVANEYTIWVLIPDNRFKLIEGGSDWVVSKSFTAFKVTTGYAVVKLDECNETTTEEKTRIHYSIMVLDERDASRSWEYVHGQNPPPKMIIPPKQWG